MHEKTSKSEAAASTAWDILENTPFEPASPSSEKHEQPKNSGFDETLADIREFSKNSAEPLTEEKIYQLAVDISRDTMLPKDVNDKWTTAGRKTMKYDASWEEYKGDRDAAWDNAYQIVKESGLTGAAAKAKLADLGYPTAKVPPSKDTEVAIEGAGPQKNDLQRRIQEARHSKLGIPDNLIREWANSDLPDAHLARDLLDRIKNTQF